MNANVGQSLQLQLGASVGLLCPLFMKHLQTQSKGTLWFKKKKRERKGRDSGLSHSLMHIPY